MNKYDSFSIPHLILYLNAMNKPENKGIVYWTELKEALKECEMKRLMKPYEVSNGQ